MYQVRPPGHHAGIKQAMGFCLHNNAAVAALAAQAAGAKKVLIVDWVILSLLFLYIDFAWLTLTGFDVLLYFSFFIFGKPGVLWF